MKPDYWNRLARAARRAPPEPPAEMPFGFDTRVVAGWQAQTERAAAMPWVFLLRGALACAALIMLLTVALNYRSLTDQEPNELALADSAIRLSLLP